MKTSATINPSSGKFTVEVGATLLNTEMQIIDVQGRIIRTVLLTDTNFSLDIKERGMYAITVKTENGTALFGKIVVQ